MKNRKSMNQRQLLHSIYYKLRNMLKDYESYKVAPMRPTNAQLIKDLREMRFKKFGEPFPVGLKQTRYFGCFWERS